MIDQSTVIAVKAVKTTIFNWGKMLTQAVRTSGIKHQFMTMYDVFTIISLHLMGFLAVDLP